MSCTLGGELSGCIPEGLGAAARVFLVLAAGGEGQSKEMLQICQRLQSRRQHRPIAMGMRSLCLMMGMVRTML